MQIELTRSSRVSDFSAGDWLQTELRSLDRLRFVLGEKYAGYYGYNADGERVYKLTGIFVSTVDAVAGEAGEDDEEDRMGGKRKAYPKPLPKGKGCFLHKRLRYLRQDGKECHYGEDDPRGGIDEVGRFDKQKRSRSHEADDGEAQHAERLLEIEIAFESFGEPEIGLTDTEHDDKARYHDSTSREHASPDTAHRVTDIRGAVDTYRTRCHLTDGHDIYEFLLRHPSVPLYLHLDKRHDRQASSKTEEAYFEERYEEL